MADLIDRKALLDAMTEYWNGIAEYHTHLDGETAVYVDNKCLVKRMPTIDAVEVVRCKDCIHMRKNSKNSLGYKLGIYDGECEMLFLFVKGNDFCKWGERRTDE